MKKIGIFAQERQYAGRIFNNLSLDYVRALESAGGFAVIIPIFTHNIDHYIEECAGFIFPGGPDIDPSLYGKVKNGARGISPDYDKFLINAMRKIFKTRKPILGICKGMQLLNIAHGGTLKQDIEEITHHFQPERGYECIDSVKEIPHDSFLGKIFGREEMQINSIHHQAVEILGHGLQVVATSTYDDEIEAIEHGDYPHFGVQWHPEYLENQKGIFSWFLEQV